MIIPTRRYALRCLSTISYSTRPCWKISNYWRKPSRTRRIRQIKGVVHRGWRPRWITPSKICRMLHIPRKLSSIIDLLFIQNISLSLREFHHFALCSAAISIFSNITLRTDLLTFRVTGAVFKIAVKCAGCRLICLPLPCCWKEWAQWPLFFIGVVYS